MLIGWKEIADFCGYTVVQVDAFRKKLLRMGIRLPTLKGRVYAFRSTLSLLKPRLSSDNRKPA